MTNVIKWDGFTKKDLDAASILREIALEKPDSVFVICWKDDETEVSYHSNIGGVPQIITEIERFKHKYLAGDFV